MKQEMIGWQWHLPDHMQSICTLLQTDSHASTAPHTQFLLAGCSSRCPTKSVEALNANTAALKWQYFFSSYKCNDFLTWVNASAVPCGGMYQSFLHMLWSWAISRASCIFAVFVEHISPSFLASTSFVLSMNISAHTYLWISVTGHPQDVTSIVQLSQLYPLA